MNMEREKGFTLVELLITIVVISVLLATGVPAFLDFIKNNRLTAQTNELVSAIQLARSEAVKRGTNTIVCASSNGTSCSDNKDDWDKVVSGEFENAMNNQDKHNLTAFARLGS